MDPQRRQALKTAPARARNHRRAVFRRARARAMSLVLAGSAIAAVVGLFLCTRRPRAPPKELSSILVGTGDHMSQISSPAELSALMAKGGKAVLYLTACW